MTFLMHNMNSTHLFNRYTMTMMNLNQSTLEIQIMKFIETNCKFRSKISNKISIPILSCIHSPGSSIPKLIHFLPFIKWFGFFFFSLRSYQKPIFFSLLNIEIYLYHLAFFLVSKFYFGIYSKVKYSKSDSLYFL